MSLRRGGLAWAAVAVGVLTVAVAAALFAVAHRHARAIAAVPVVDRGALPTRSGAVRSHHIASRPTTHSAPLPSESRLDYERLGMHASIIRVRAVHGVMQVPLDPRVLGWWAGSSAPGDDAGTVVVVGHINYAGTPGLLSALPEAKPGDRVTVDEPGPHDVAYRVRAVRTYPKTSGIPQDVFSRAGSARLVLITCGGPFDPSTGNYEDNIVVYATPA